MTAPGRGGGADVAPYGQGHPDEARRPRQKGPAQETEHPEDPGRGEGQSHHGVAVLNVRHLGGGEEDEDGQGDDDEGDGPELPAQEGLGPLLDGRRDLAHLGRARVGGEDPPHEDQAHDDSEEGGGQGDHQPGLLGAVEDEALVPPFSDHVAHAPAAPFVDFPAPRGYPAAGRYRLHTTTAKDGASGVPLAGPVGAALGCVLRCGPPRPRCRARR